MKARLPRKLAAILYADVAEYTRLTSEDEDATHRLLSNYLDLISIIVERCGGRVVHYAGDAVLVMYGAVVDALRSAVEIQAQLHRRNDPLPDNRKVRFRIGVNMGDVIEDRDDIYGEGVNVAARLEGLAEPGGICISDAVRSAVGGKLELEYEFMGELTVKNIPEPLRAYRVLPVSWGGSERSSRETPELKTPEKPSIVVLPFTNMSGEPEQSYFSDGITEDIITALSRISDIFVIARMSSFVYRDSARRVQDVVRELGVRYLLEGSVRKSDNRVRITAQLIDGTTEHHLWAERYDRNLDDIFSIQDDITHRVVVALQVKLTAGEMARQWAGGTDNREAWECMILGREHHLRFNAEDNAIARQLFERALEIDSNYGSARVWLGFTHWIDAKMAYTRDPGLSLELAQRQVKELEATEHGRSLAHLLVGSIHHLKGEHEEAICAARAAVEFSHGAGDHANLGMILYFAGRPAEAIKELRTAMRLSPYHANWFLYHLSAAYLWHGDVEQAVEVGNDYLAREPNDPFAYANLAVIYSMGGRSDEARSCVTRLLSRYPTFDLSYFASTQPFRDSTQLEQVLQALRKAGLPD